MRVQTRVRPFLLRRALHRMLFIAVPGGLMLALGYFFPFSLCLIAYGGVPYRQLMRLRTQPSELFWDGQTLLYTVRGKPQLLIPGSAIQKLEFREYGSHYGAALWLTPEPKPTRLSRRIGCDLFLPYFESHRVDDIRDQIEECRAYE